MLHVETYSHFTFIAQKTQNRITKKCNMKKNISTTDRIVRIVLAAILGGLYFTGTVTGTAGIILLVLAVIALGTALINFCPAYALLGISTCKVKS